MEAHNMANEQRDYYEVLGVTRDAGQKAIKDAFRKLAMQYHPDRNKAPDAEAKFKEIAEAYAVLSDPDKRAKYDTRGFAGVADFTPEDLFGGIDFGDIFADMGFGFDFGGNSIFDRFFSHRPAGPRRGQDLEVRLEIPLERIAHGGEELVHFKRVVSCPDCSGTGAKAGTTPRQCEACGGSGRKVITRDEKQEKGSVRFQQITMCPECHGQGSFIDHPCPRCQGYGQIEKEESLKVQIPIGVEEGTALRIHGHGMPSTEPGGQAGDLYVRVHSNADARFERVGADLWRRQTVEVADAVLGGRFKVPTLDGEVEVKLPPGTQPDEVLRLRGKGLPNYGNNARGDLKISIQVHIPEKMSDAEKALYKQLREFDKTCETKKHWWTS